MSVITKIINTEEVYCPDEDVCDWFGDATEMVMRFGRGHCPDCGKVITISYSEMIKKFGTKEAIAKLAEV